MRIGIDIRSLIEPFPSGVSEYTFSLVKHLIATDQENSYLLFYNSAWRELPDRYRDFFDKKSMTIIRWRWPNKIINALFFLNLFPKIDKVLKGLDVFFLPNMNFFSLSRTCRLIITVHDLSYTFPGFFSLKSRLWHWLIRPRKIFSRADKIICVSESTKHDLEKIYHLSPDKIKIVYPGVDHDFYAQVSETDIQRVKAKYNLPDTFFLYLGNVENRKNIVGIIQAWQFMKRRQPPFSLVIAGNIMENKRFAKDKSIIFLGYIDQADKPALYQSAKALAYPSFYEGFGLPIVEAMSAGCPVICGFGSAMPEITIGAALMVDPNNINDIAQAMEKIIIDQPFRLGLITKGKNLAKAYTWEHAAEESLKLIRELSLK